jgi:hypothetical protein
MPSGAGPGGALLLGILGAKSAETGGFPATSANVDQAVIVISANRPIDTKNFIISTLIFLK